MASNNAAALRMRGADREIRRLVVRLVVTKPGDRVCEVVNRNDCRVITHMSYTAAQKLQNGEYKWQVCLAVYMRNRIGEEFIQTEIVKPSRPCKQSELVDILQEKHQQFIASQYGDFVISAGWVAVPTPGEVNFNKLLDVPEVWLNPAKWECEEK